jgi:hypothetical protein
MKDIYELGCTAGLLNYIDHETPRVYFVHAHAELEDFEAFCKALTKERDDEIERLREALQEYTCDCERGWCQGIRGEVCGGPARSALGEGKE